MYNKKLLIDTDMGLDDIIAICMLLLSPRIAIQRITVAEGVAHVARGANNLFQILHWIGGHACFIPVSQGANSHLSSKATFPNRDREEADYLPFLSHLLRYKEGYQSSGISYADEALFSEVIQAPGKLSLICLGPLTNVANAIAVYQDKFVRNLKEVIIMGGAIHATGNAPPDKVAEYNMYIDPVAADIVLRSGADILLVGTDVTQQIPFEDWREELENTGEYFFVDCPAAQIIKEVTQGVTTLDYLYDPLVAGIVIDPGIITKSEVLPLKVETRGERRGQIIIDELGSPIKVALEINQDRFYTLWHKLVEELKEIS